MDNISKISAEYSIELTEPHSVRILLCYLLDKLEKPITPVQLYDIVVGNEIVNYFYFTEALNDLTKNNTITAQKIDGVEYYVLSPKGKCGTEEFKQYVPKSFRDRVLKEALKYFAKLKQQNEVQCEITELKHGFYVEFKILDENDNLIEMKLFAPDKEQAKIIKHQIMLNPTDFYSKIIGYVLENKEYEPEI